MWVLGNTNKSNCTLWKTLFSSPFPGLNFSLKTSLVLLQVALRHLWDGIDSKGLRCGCSLLFLPSCSFPLLQRRPPVGCHLFGVYLLPYGLICGQRSLWWRNSSWVSYVCVGCLLRITRPSLIFGNPLLLPTGFVSLCGPFLNSWISFHRQLC